MGLRVTVQVDTTVPSGGRIRIVNQSVTGPAGVGVPAGGSTGQVLGKTSNADYATGWTNAVLPTIVDAKGDLIVGTGADTVARLAVGTNGYLLAADSAVSTGVKWTYNQVSQRAPQLLQANSYGVPGAIVTNYNSGIAIGPNQIHTQPFIITRPLTITKIALRNNTAITTNTVARCGIYASDSNGLPSGNTLITSDLSYPNGTGGGTTIANTVSLNLYPGLYWQVLLYSGANMTWFAWSSTLNNAIGIMNSGAQTAVGNFNNFTFGALPAASSLPAPGSRSFWHTFYDWTWL